MSAEQGMRYRNEVLTYGGARDERIMLKRFLGREPNMEAFYDGIGLGS